MGTYNVREVRQGDPLSPLLFCTGEEVLSRGILHSRDEGKLSYISSLRGVRELSYVFYTDDLIIFYRADMSLWKHMAECLGKLLARRRAVFFLQKIL